jgi:hypothetical protein
LAVSKPALGIRRLVETRAQGEKMTAASPRPWLPEDDEHLRTLAFEGNSPAVIAKRLGRTEEAIRSRARKLLVSFKRKSGGGLLAAVGLKAKSK